MWHDIETTKDLLNFKIVADTAAQIINDAEDQPVSIGVSGGWGTGKTSLVKMIGESIKEKDASNEKYIFIDFNAWLYQGYDDARIALLQSVADRLLEETKARQTCVEKAKSFASRIDFLKLGRIVVPTATTAILGGVAGGPLGAVIGAVGGILKASDGPSEEDIKNLKNAYDQLSPELAGLIKDKKQESLPKEISALRNTFEDILSSLNINLVLLIDDLDRCLSKTAISTLEAMRLLLFIPRTAFIIAADEEMIRNAVRVHFGNVPISDDLVTSYFDKLIQVPLRVPRLGVTEVKAYLALLLADLAVRRGHISIKTMEKAQRNILEAVRKSWSVRLTRKSIAEAFGSEAEKIEMQIDIADQLAEIMATAPHISGNPRLIKRFLNNLIIRENIAKIQDISLPFDALVKVQLFERCASPAAFEFLVKKVAESGDGKIELFEQIESKIANGEKHELPDKSWDDPFIHGWLKISPKLSNMNLRPILHLSKNKTISIANYDELSSTAQDLLSTMLEIDTIDQLIIQQLVNIGETEAERILIRLNRRARSEQYEITSIKRALNVPEAFPALAPSFVSLLREIPAKKRVAPLIPFLGKHNWAQETLKEWSDDDPSPKSVIRAINSLKRRK